MSDQDDQGVAITGNLNQKSDPAQKSVPVTKMVWLVLAGIAAVVIPIFAFGRELIADWNTTESSVGSLSATAGKNLNSLGSYAVPVDAPFDSFPTRLVPSPDGRYFVCSEEQHTWLSRYGRLFVDSVIVDLSNTAQVGAPITVRDFTMHGKTAAAQVPLFPVICITPTGGAIDADTGTLQADGTSTATFSDARADSQDRNIVPKSPAAYNLPPGESAILFLRLQVPRDFEGSLAATVSSGGKDKTITIPVDGSSDPILVPDFSRVSGFKLLVGQAWGDEEAKAGVLACFQGEESHPCSREFVVERLKDFKR
ncbi:hypothetical protein SRABI26_04571 [Arthrobacter sp. Bi26]|uniref:hypothetical protein n=1 Tax=Arthrobacter sp. Bi26 TaxID=2822350 RepID=UPI001DCBE9BD|nr:hypothetical protein [Arthrobacter sp. Bi26]CAH0301992.1 hypothetical protein SRABI26_04571 [Arthrobacter sp. Bi26]